MYHRKSMGKLHLYHKNKTELGQGFGANISDVTKLPSFVRRGHSNSAMTWGKCSL